ncbi:uncharacterized protein LOC131570101 isoform X2 [Ammospiza caudacuta]|uniref:uncharacterized protein LOC131570101 isoform X2 n=1 Tax=Ammospiza caudacuta TaxID=2857398 RepID=UPI002738B9BD|nr:uncharacterized protein LOC131570101 isoform X2 [Ammospiza caudacuta]
MAGAGGGRRSAGATPRVTRSSSLRSVVSEPRGGRSPRDPRDRSPDFERPRRSPRLQSQKENGPSPPCAPSPVCAAPSPSCAPSPPPSPLPSPLPRVRRSYSRLEGGGGGVQPAGGAPPEPPPSQRAPPPPRAPSPPAPPDLPPRPPRHRPRPP